MKEPIFTHSQWIMRYVLNHDTRWFYGEGLAKGCQSIATLPEGQVRSACLTTQSDMPTSSLKLTINSSDLRFWARGRMLSSFWLTRDTRWCLARPSAEKESPFHNPASFWIFRAPLFWSSAHASIIWKFRINPFYTITGNLRRKWRRLCTLKTFWKVSYCWSRKYQSVAGSLTIF